MIRNFKITLEYDGRDFCGWQRQADGRPSIQGRLEEALTRLCQEPIVAHGSGRTDAGVHARAQVASFTISSPRTALEITRGGNALLPRQIAILETAEVPLDFHARFSARAKVYSYDLYTRATPPALLAERAWWVKDQLDWERLAEALPYLIGHRDFAAFRSLGTDLKSTRRHLMSASLSEPESYLKRLTFKGDGFMRHMVRALVGTLVLVGRRKLAPQDLQEIIKAGRRELAGPNAPACGLYLDEVIY